MNKLEGLVEEYLSQVDRDIADLPGSRRVELLGDLREHIATARAELPVETEAGIREILGQLGQPAEIAAAAHDAADLPSPSHGRPRFRIGRAAMMRVAVAVLVLLVLVVFCAALFFMTRSSSGVARGEPARTVGTPIR